MNLLSALPILFGVLWFVGYLHNKSQSFLIISQVFIAAQFVVSALLAK